MQRKMFEDQMRALEQQQARELLNIPTDLSAGSLQHLAVSAPTTPPRVNAVLSDEVSSGMGSGLSSSSMDADVLSKAVGSAVSDKRKSVTYAPSVNHSPEMHSDNAGHQSFARPGAKSMPASRRTSASEHDEELAGHLQGLSLAGERAERERFSIPPGTVPQSILRSGNERYGVPNGQHYGNAFNAGMMLDEQLDQEMHSTSISSVRQSSYSSDAPDAMRNLPTSDEDKFSNAYSNKVCLTHYAHVVAQLFMR